MRHGRLNLGFTRVTSTTVQLKLSGVVDGRGGE